MHKASLRRGHLGLIYTVGCLFLAGAVRFADAAPPANRKDPPPEPKTQTPTKAEVQSQAPARPRPTRRPQTPRRKGRTKYTLDPDVKFACAETTVTLPPLWRNNGEVTFGFDIRNEGTANLKFTAAGGG